MNSASVGPWSPGTHRLFFRTTLLPADKRKETAAIIRIGRIGKIGFSKSDRHSKNN